MQIHFFFFFSDNTGNVWLVILYLTTESENSLDFVLTSHIDTFPECPHVEHMIQIFESVLKPLYIWLRPCLSKAGHCPVNLWVSQVHLSDCLYIAFFSIFQTYKNPDKI